MKISVLVTTYGRRDYLDRCLRSLLAQARPADEVVLVTRRGDAETDAFVSAFLGRRHGAVTFRRAEVGEPGVLAANRAGLPLASGDILCFLDDDAAARPDWVAGIEARFAADPRLGALGGRDLNHTAAGVDDEPAAEVGRIRWYGRIIGNHHKRSPGLRRVETLKGCNMAFRRFLVTGFDDGFIGSAHYYESDLCFAVRRAGYEVMYDGDLVVDHYVEAPRHLPGSAGPADPRRLFYLHHNRVYLMMKNLPPLRRAVFLAYTFLSDAAAAPVRWTSGSPEGRPEAIREMFRGKVEGLRRWRSRRPAASARTSEAAS